MVPWLRSTTRGRCCLIRFVVARTTKGFGTGQDPPVHRRRRRRRRRPHRQPHTVTPTPSASPQYGIRRHAWIGGIQLQIRRLGTQAARSAVQTLLLRHPGIPRAEYEALVEPIVKYLLTDTEDRVRLARQAGASPLDLAIGAALLGLHSLAEDLCARCRTPESRLQGEMVDRMWDTMCHEIPRDLAQSLGGNPRISRRLRLE